MCDSNQIDSLEQSQQEEYNQEIEQDNNEEPKIDEQDKKRKGPNRPST